MEENQHIISLSSAPLISPLPPPPPLQRPSEDCSEEPALKKTKMSTTTDDDTTTMTTESKPRRYKRRKVAIFFAYCGVGYQGMQKNPGAKTIEGDLEEALYSTGAVPEDERGQHKRYDWARSARTDKGVSAVGQVVSGKFFVDPPGFVHRLNSTLSPQIRIFGYKRVTPMFSAKKFCDRRRYVYLLPVFALDPSCHRDRESVMASLGSDEELVKCVECSERGRKVAGVMGSKRDRRIVGGFQSGISSNTCDELALRDEVEVKGGENDENGVVVKSEDLAESKFTSNTCDGSVLPEEVELKEGEKGDVSVENDENGGALRSEDLVESVIQSNDGVELEDNSNGEGVTDKKHEFVFGEEVRERFNRILKYYEGTHNFHNFTTRIKAEDPSAKRYIVSFQANTTLTLEGIEFVKCEVVGQSFMLHQIRKMMGMAVAVMRNFASESIYETAFDQSVNINVPTAPEVGLYLDECFFTSYNNKWNETHEEVSMKAYAEEAEEFKLKHIYSHIASTEHKEGSVALWLHSLNRRNYPDLCSPEVEVEGAAEGDTVVVPQ